MLHLDYDKVIEAYGGSIPRITQAAATGALGPNGVLLGLAAVNKIKMIRDAAAAEQMPTTTVAQDLGMAPPPPQGAAPPQGGMPPGAPPAPAGLGATPQAMAMAPSAPPMGGGAPAVGMAGGGDVDVSKYRMPKADQSYDDHNHSIMEAIRHLTGEGVHHRAGKAELYARYNPLDRYSEYRADYPIGDHTGLFANATSDPHERRYVAGIRHEFADGGMVGPYYASGGLSDLPVPDTMFDEPSNGGYAHGGIVAFAGAGPVTDDTADLPDTFYGYNWRDPMANAQARDTLFGKMQTAYQDAAEQDLLRRQGAAYQNAEKGKSMGQLMAEFGFGMAAGQSPYALQNAATAALPAISNATSREKERRAEERDIQRGLIDIEQGRNTASAQRAAQMLQMQELGIRGMESAMSRKEAAKERQNRITIEGMQQSGAYNRALLNGSDGDGTGTGRGHKLTPNRRSELGEKLDTAYSDQDKAYNAWVKKGKPALGQVKQGTPAWEIANNYAAARSKVNRLRKELGQPLLPELRADPTGWTNRRPVRVDKRRAVQDGNILHFDKNGNPI